MNMRPKSFEWRGLKFNLDSAYGYYRRPKGLSRRVDISILECTNGWRAEVNVDKQVVGIGNGTDPVLALNRAVADAISDCNTQLSHIYRQETNMLDALDQLNYDDWGE